MHSAATQSALHFHVTQILIENPRQRLTTQPVGNIQHRFLSKHFAPTRHIVPFSVLGWDILILLKKIACHRETNPPLSPQFWPYAYACAMVFMTRILSFETDYPRVSRNPTRWSRGTKTLGTRLKFREIEIECRRAFPGIREIRFQALSHDFSAVYRMECRVKRYSHPVGF